MSAATGSGARLLPLFLVVFVSLMGFGVVLPVFPFWGRALGASPAIITVALGAYSLGQFIGSPLWGRLSDRFGRRPVLIVSLAGGILSYVWMALAADIWSLAAARLFGGLMAGNIAVAFAYVGDVAGEAERPRAMGLLGAAFGLGFIFGPAVGGLVAGADPSLPDFARVAAVAAAITALSALLVWWRLPESLSPERRRAVRAAGGGPTPRALLAEKPAVLALMAVALLVIGSAAMMETTFALFADDILAWSPRDVGLAFGLIGTISAAAQGGGAAPLARRFGPRRVALGGILLYTLGLLGLGFAAGSAAVLLALAVTALGVGTFNPAYQTLVAATTDDQDRGLVNGLTQGASAMGRIIGPAVSGSLYEALGPSSPFLIGAGLMAVALLVAMGAGRMVRARNMA
jgi:DHA1 family tetracycline resistance protein-like MFS transporter